jgi:tetratricopeptide (TPR) repeat protein
MKPVQPIRLPHIEFVLFLSLLVAYGLATFERNFVWTSGLTLWSDMVKKSFQKARPHYNLGHSYADNGDYGRAITEYRMAISLSPNFVDAHNSLGVAYYNKGLHAKAIQKYEDALKINKNCFRAYYNLGVIHLRQGLIDRAISENLMVLKLRPSHWEARFNLATAYGRKGLTGQAIAEYQKALKLKPDNADIWYNLGIAFREKKIYGQAVKILEKAVQLKPNDAEAHLELANLYLHKVKNREKALFHYRRVLMINPAHQDGQRIRKAITMLTFAALYYPCLYLLLNAFPSPISLLASSCNPFFQ